jgi:hypothetical protein
MARWCVEAARGELIEVKRRGERANGEQRKGRVNRPPTIQSRFSEIRVAGAALDF